MGVTQYVQDKNSKEDDVMCATLKMIKRKTPQELLNEYNIDIKSPIDIAKLLNKIGISTIAQDFFDIEELMQKKKDSILGAAFSKEDNLAIFYKKSDTFRRKNFTIAHELAHCCLHCPNDTSSHIEFRIEPFIDELSMEEFKKEREANIFAGEILIPEESLKIYYNKMLIPSLLALAKIFDVSTSVMAARLDYLQLPYYKDSQTTEIIMS